MVQQIRVHTALEEGLSSVPRSHTKQFSTACNSNSKESNTLSGFLTVLTCRHMYRHTCRPPAHICICTSTHSHTHRDICVHTGLLKTIQKVCTRPCICTDIRTPTPHPQKSSEKPVSAQSGPYKMHEVKAFQTILDTLEMRLMKLALSITKSAAPSPSTQVTNCT